MTTVAVDMTALTAAVLEHDAERLTAASDQQLQHESERAESLPKSAYEQTLVALIDDELARRHPLHRALRLLHALGTTADQVADRLRALGIKGKLDVAAGCPIANYLEVNSTPSSVDVEWFSLVGDPTETHHKMPPAAALFIRRFDDGVYLDLVEGGA